MWFQKHVSCLWEDLERSTDNKSHHLSGQREMHMCNRYLAVGLHEGNQQSAGQEVSKSLEAAASFTPQPQHGLFSSGTAQPWVPCCYLSRMLIGTAELVSAREGQIPKALALQLGLQCREERIYTLEYNVRTNPGLQKSVFTGSYYSSMSEIGFSL